MAIPIHIGEDDAVGYGPVRAKGALKITRTRHDTIAAVEIDGTAGIVHHDDV